MSTLPWQAVLIFGFILGAGVTFGVLTWFYFNVKGDLDNTADGADGDCEPPIYSPKYAESIVEIPRGAAGFVLTMEDGSVVTEWQDEFGNPVHEITKDDLGTVITTNPPIYYPPVRASDDKTPENGGQER